MLAFLDDLLLLVAVLPLWSCARSFSISVRSITRDLVRKMTDGKHIIKQEFVYQWIQVDTHFKALRHLSNLISETFGVFYLVFMIRDILYYSTNFNEVFIQQRHSDWTTALRVAFFFCNSTAVLILSANIASQVASLEEFLQISQPIVPSLESRTIGGKEWTHEGYHMPFEHIFLYEKELAKNSVAIKAANVFPITYSLVANVCAHH